MQFVYNVLRLCVRLRSVGIERSGSLHKTAVMRCRFPLTYLRSTKPFFLKLF